MLCLKSKGMCLCLKVTPHSQPGSMCGRFQQWQSDIVGHARRWPQISHCVQHRLPADLLACCMMYLPIIFRWPLWVWWLMQIFRLNRYGRPQCSLALRETASALTIKDEVDGGVSCNCLSLRLFRNDWCMTRLYASHCIFASQHLCFLFMSSSTGKQIGT